MKTASKKSIGNTAAQAPIIIKSGGGGVAMPLTIGGLSLAAYFFILKPMLEQRSKNSAESDNSPEGQIAIQLKTVFDKFPVSDKDYLLVAAQITPANKARVYELYRKLTGNNLSDEIANHITTGYQANATKVQGYNSKPGKLFSITPEGKVKFEVAPGDFIGFAKGQTSPITVYNALLGVSLNDFKSNPKYNEIISALKKNPKTIGLTVSVDIKPNANKYKVVETKTFAVNGIQPADDFWKVIRPYVKTAKTYAAVRILSGFTKEKKPIYAWVDGRDMVSLKALSGLGTIDKLI